MFYDGHPASERIPNSVGGVYVCLCVEHEDEIGGHLQYCQTNRITNCGNLLDSVSRFCNREDVFARSNQRFGAPVLRRCCLIIRDCFQIDHTLLESST